MSLRQKEVTELLLKGLTIKEIAFELNCTPQNIKYHLTNIYKIHGVKGRYQLASRMMVAKSSEGYNESKEVSIECPLIKGQKV